MHLTEGMAWQSLAESRERSSMDGMAYGSFIDYESQNI